MLGTEIVAHLAGAGLGLTAGTNLFSVPFPESAQDDVVSVVTYGGGASERSFGPSLQAPAAEVDVRFQVMVRSGRDGAATAEALADAIYKKLDGLGPLSLSGVLYHDVVSTDGPPKFLSFDDNNRPRYYMNFAATKERS